MWDLSILQVVPDLWIAAPRDAVRLRALMREALQHDGGPSVLRFPKGAVTEEIAAVGEAGGLDVLAECGDVPDVLIVSVGAMAQVAIDTAARLRDQGVGVRVVDPRWLAPVPAGLIALAADSDIVAVIEDSGRVGGFGSRLAQAITDAGLDRPVRTFAIPQRFLPHATRAQLQSELGLTPAAIAASLVAQVASCSDPVTIAEPVEQAPQG
jgi:1-deoxy-D-xylulose-5-phosphate synthase